MDLLIAFSVFIAAIVVCTVLGIATYIPMTLGLFLFIFTALWRNCSVKTILQAIWAGVKESPKIMTIFLFVGALTALWRMSGVISYFVYYGVKLITPSLFILLSFLLSMLVAYALGSTVGVVSTVGIIFMTIARSGGVNLFWTAGAILSGSFLAERCSPTSSCQNLISGLCKVDLYRHVRLLQRNAAVPFLLCLVFYGIISVLHPLQSVDSKILTATCVDFRLSPWLLLPMGLILLLPVLKVDVRWAILVSTVSAGVLAVILQHQTPLAAIKAALFGFTASQSSMGALWNGGGIVSMLSIIAVFVLAYIYSKLFEAANMLQSLHQIVNRSIDRLGQTVTVILISVVFSGIFCSGTTAAILAILLLREPYQKHGYSQEELGQDMGT